MKKIITIAIILSLLMVMISCDNNKGTNYDYESRFISLNIRYEITDGKFEIVVDNTTKLIYLSSVSNYALSPLFNKNGKQYTETEFMDEYRNSIYREE